MATAVIDIGTNTLLLLIVDDAMQPIVDLCRFGRLGKGLDATGRLAADAIANSLEICREYRRVMDHHGVAHPIVIATQAAREAKNAAEFVGAGEQILNAPIEVIAGRREESSAARRWRARSGARRRATWWSTSAAARPGSSRSTAGGSTPRSAARSAPCG
jgi:exopolyphosphatase/guanosine-5'-triphosphate,3'-diphosphate pyrophosphatase